MLLKVLKSLGVSMSTVGVICPYRQQLVEAQNRFCSQGSGFEGLEVHTVDKFQGRDKDVIIMTCVRSKASTEDQESQKRNTNELLSDKQRVNVAMSRAKSKLIIVGDLNCLKGYDPMRVIIDILCQSKCVVQFDKHLSSSAN